MRRVYAPPLAQLAAHMSSTDMRSCFSRSSAPSYSSPSPLSLHNPVISLTLDASTRHTRPNIPLEALAVPSQILRRLLVERIAGVGLEEQKLQAHNHRVEVQHGLPVLAQDVQAHVALEVDVRVVDFLRALDLWRLVREVLRYVECEAEDAALVHALVGRDCEREV